MDTTKILFICGGAFVGLDKIIHRRLGNRVMGFAAAEQNAAGRNSPAHNVWRQIEPEDLLGYGFIPEFIGRLPVVTVLDELNESQLVSILTEPKNALTKQFAKLLAMENVELEFSPDALRELATQALHKGTGARALRSLVEKLMLDLMYDIPSANDVTGVTITSAVVRGESPPLLHRKTNRQAA